MLGGLILLSALISATRMPGMGAPSDMHVCCDDYAEIQM